MVMPKIIANSDTPRITHCEKGKYENILRIIIPIATNIKTEKACINAAPLGRALLYMADFIVWNGGSPDPYSHPNTIKAHAISITGF